MLVNTIALNDGSLTTIRPVQPQDAFWLYDMHGRASHESLFYRYLSSHVPSYEDVSLISQIGAEEGVALVATLQRPHKEIIGMAYYLIDDDPSRLTAQPAILIEDRYQGAGLGSFLWRLLCQQGVEGGLAAFNVDVHPTNERMLKLIQRSGFPFKTQTSFGTLEVRMELQGEMAMA